MKITRFMIFGIIFFLLSFIPCIQAQSATTLASIPDGNPSEIFTPRGIDTLFTCALYSFQTKRALDLLDSGANIEFRGWF